MTPSASRVDPQATRVVTEKCLIAADVDKTILSQDKDLDAEKHFFFQRLAPELVEAARLGAHVGFITGNSMHELCSRVLRFLLIELDHRNALNVIDRFHFFCNSGGVYFHLGEADLARSRNARAGVQERLRGIIVPGQSELSIHPKFIDSAYLERSMIQAGDVDKIKAIMVEATDEYLADVDSKMAEYEHQYDLSWVREGASLKRPHADLRLIRYRSASEDRMATVQITLKPVLSFRQAPRELQTALFGRDLRTRVIQSIQNKMDRVGLGQYVARAGGRASIDITLERLDKAYALEFLIDRLRLQGNAHRGQQIGSNTIYFGDEVIVGSGNDYPVTRIPGLMTFAVNPDKNLVPFLSPVLVASAIFDGPDATAEIVGRFNSCARRLLADFCVDQPNIRTAIELLKEEIFAERIEKKIAHLKGRGISVDDWQALHTFVTLVSRENSAARQWLSVMVKELDTIMIQLATSGKTAVPPALGTSRG